MSFLEHGEGTNPKWGAGTPHFFFIQKILKPDGVSTELVRS